MSLQELSSKANKTRKRVGRGNGSGHGTFSCRGMKGQSARSGGRRRPGFEGGQTPYLRRMPKLKGFKNPNRVECQVVNVGDLNIFNDGDKITAEILKEKNIISKTTQPVKLLAGKGDLEKSVEITVDKASAKAIEIMTAKKGKVNLPEPKPKAVKGEKKVRKEKEEKK